jgi:hypothetical protein
VSRKTSTVNYGSNGSTCGLEVELASSLLADPPKLAETIRRHFALCETAVDDELAKLGRSDTSATSVPTETVATTAAPRATNGHGTSNGNGHLPRNGSRTSEPPATEYDDPGQVAAEDEDEDRPTTGRQLLGWSQKQPGDAKGFLIRFGKKRELPPRILDWNERQVATAYRAYRQAAINGLAEKGGR